jgi:hypothetical protein
MAHWFDDITLELSRPTNSERRSLLKILGGGLGATMFQRSAIAQPAPAPTTPSPPGVIPPSNIHIRRALGSLIIHEASQTRDGITLQVQLAFNRSTKNATFITTISRGPALIARIDGSAITGGPATVSMTFGAEVAGARKLTLTIEPNNTVHGVIDGRAFAARGGPNLQPAQIHFADRQPQPVVTINPAVVGIINQLQASVKAALAAPIPPQIQIRPIIRTPESATLRRRVILSAPGTDWYEPSDDPVACTNCENHCNDVFYDNQPGADTLFFCPPCAAYQEGRAFVIWTGCMGLCNIPGGGCLPTPCGTFTTCGANDQCFDVQTGPLCCPAPAAVCQNICCGTNVTTCAPDGGCGCPSGQNACGNDCCKPGQTCHDGVCCDHSDAINCKGVCCEPGNICTQDGCCRPNNMCNGLCCEPFNTPNGYFGPAMECCNNTHCCQQGTCCGTKCCGQGETCLDPSTGTCCQLVCNGKCCPPGSGTCCDGVCCPPGQNYCTADGCCDSLRICGDKCCAPGLVCASANHTCVPQKQLSCGPGEHICISDDGSVQICCPPGKYCRYTDGVCAELH